MYDVGIVGCGPAEATVARALTPGIRAAVFDASPRDDGATDPLQARAYGSLIAPDAQRVLAEMDIAVPRPALVVPQVFGRSMYRPASNGITIAITHTSTEKNSIAFSLGISSTASTVGTKRGRARWWTRAITLRATRCAPAYQPVAIAQAV